MQIAQNILGEKNPECESDMRKTAEVIFLIYIFEKKIVL